MTIQTQIARALNTKLNCKFFSLSVINKLEIVKSSGEQMCLTPVRKAGSGKWSHYTDNRYEITRALDLMGVPYTYDNVAPKGGMHGMRFYYSRTDLISRITELTGIEIA